MSSHSFSFGASPSVSKERWLKHAVHKLAKGYNLLVNHDRKVANFYKGYGDFESCAYKTARKLILHEYVELLGEHEMGLEYTLKSDKDLDVTSVTEDDIDEVEMDADEVIEETTDVMNEDDLDDVEAEEEYDDIRPAQDEHE